MSFPALSRRALLGAAIVTMAAAVPASAQSDDLSGIPNVERLTEQEQATYRRRLRDASGDQERARIREEARLQAQQRAGQGQGRRQQGSGGSQGGGNPQGSGGQGGGQGGAGQAKRRIPGTGGGRSN